MPPIEEQHAISNTAAIANIFFTLPRSKRVLFHNRGIITLFGISSNTITLVTCFAQLVVFFEEKRNLLILPITKYLHLPVGCIP